MGMGGSELNFRVKRHAPPLEEADPWKRPSESGQCERERESSHATALEPVDCLRANKRTQLTALRSRALLVKERDRARASVLPRAGLMAHNHQVHLRKSID